MSADDKMWVVAVRDHDTATMHLLRGDGLQDLRENLAYLDRGAEAQVRHWEIVVHVPVPASGITFHDLGPRALHDVVDTTRAAAGRHPAFGGIAIHYYTSYRRLLDADASVAGAVDKRQPPNAQDSESAGQR